MDRSPETLRVLLVCKRNSHRSPLAAQIFQRETVQLSLGWRVSSAGLNPAQSPIEKLIARSLQTSAVYGNVVDPRLAYSALRSANHMLNTAGFANQPDLSNDDMQTFAALTPEMLAQQTHVFCFTGRQLSDIEDMKDSLSVGTSKPVIHLLSKYAGIGGEIADPNTLIVRNCFRHHGVKVAGTVLNCLWAHEYSLASQVLVGILSREPDMVERLNAHQVRKIERCVTLAIAKMQKELSRPEFITRTA